MTIKCSICGQEATTILEKGDKLICGTCLQNSYRCTNCSLVSMKLVEYQGKKVCPKCNKQLTAKAAEEKAVKEKAAKLAKRPKSKQVK